MCQQTNGSNSRCIVQGGIRSCQSSNWSGNNNNNWNNNWNNNNGICTSGDTNACRSSYNSYTAYCCQQQGQPGKYCCDDNTNNNNNNNNNNTSSTTGRCNSQDTADCASANGASWYCCNDGNQKWCCDANNPGSSGNTGGNNNNVDACAAAGVDDNGYCDATGAAVYCAHYDQNGNPVAAQVTSYPCAQYNLTCSTSCPNVSGAYCCNTNGNAGNPPRPGDSNTPDPECQNAPDWWMNCRDNTNYEYCYQGHYGTDMCRAGQTCVDDAEPYGYGAGPNCVDNDQLNPGGGGPGGPGGPPGGDPCMGYTLEGTCEGNTVVWCDGNSVQRQDCGAWTCEYNNTDNQYECQNII
jgi:hypothetical protein